MDLKALFSAETPSDDAAFWRAQSPLATVLTMVAATAAVVLLNLLLVGELSFFFDLCFLVICLVGGLMVRPGEVWNVAMVPPILLVGTVFFLAALSPATVAAPGDAWVQAVITGITTHASGLFLGYLLFGGALWTGAQEPSVTGWDEFQEQPEEGQSSNRDGSPDPTRSTSG